MSRSGLEQLLFASICGNFRLRVPTGYQKTVEFERYLSAQAWRYSELLLGDTWLKQRYEDWEFKYATLGKCIFIADVRDVLVVEQKLKDLFHKNLPEPVQTRIKSVTEIGSSIVDEIAFLNNVDVDETSVFDTNERHWQSFNEKMPKDSTISDWKELISKKWSVAVRRVSDPDGDPEYKDGKPTNAKWIFHRCHRVFASIIKNWKTNVAPYHNWFMDKWRSENERIGDIKEHTIESLQQYFIDKETEFTGTIIQNGPPACSLGARCCLTLGLASRATNKQHFSKTPNSSSAKLL